MQAAGRASAERAIIGRRARRRGQDGGAADDRTAGGPISKAHEEAFSEVFRTHSARIYRYCLYRTNSWQDAEDITAEVFVRLLKNSVPEQYLLPWLFKVAGNLCINHAVRLKKALEVQERAGRTEAGASGQGVHLLERPFSDDSVQSIFSRLKSKEQQVVFLRVVEDLTFEQIAEAIGKSKGATKMLYYRAVEKLRATQGVDHV